MPLISSVWGQGQKKMEDERGLWGRGGAGERDGGGGGAFIKERRRTHHRTQVKTFPIALDPSLSFD